jgi:hypothetical protein
LSSQAKEIQAKYGRRTIPAAVLKRRKRTMVASSDSHNALRSTRAHNGCCRPKKRTVHNAFSTSWTPYAVNAQPPCPGVFALQAKNPATPMLRYNTVHTGPKIQSGGAKSGFLRPAYHSPGGKKDPISAGRNESARKAVIRISVPKEISIDSQSNRRSEQESTSKERDQKTSPGVRKFR